MKVIEILNNKSHRQFPSFEIVPPLKWSDTAKLYDSLEPLMEFNPPFINFTAHRDEVVYRKNPDGSFERAVVSKRPGTLAVAAAVAKKFKEIEIVPHVICGGLTADQNESLLLDLNFIGIHNVMALRGDARPGEKYFEQTAGGHLHTSELVAQIKEMNEGVYLNSKVKDAVKTDFCIGVGGYPEKHIEAPNLETDIKNLKKKVDAGADYIITQMFFDNSKYFSFVEKCRSVGIQVPILPGIKPLSTRKQFNTLPHAFSIDFPEELVKEIAKCKEDAEIYECGIAWCTAQCKELLKSGVPAVHFYTMGRADNIKKILRSVF